jgi:hypothetical protein
MVWLISVAVTVTGEVMPTEKEETATTALLAKSTTIFSMRAARCWILAERAQREARRANHRPGGLEVG